LVIGGPVAAGFVGISSAPVGCNSAPVGDQSAPVGYQSPPVGDQSSPVGDQSSPCPEVPNGSGDLPSLAVNFQNSRAPVPAGWVPDFGKAYDAARGFGWRLPGGGVPIKRQCGDRNSTSDQVLDTFCHAQTRYTLIDGRWEALPAPAVWETSVPNGNYDVTVTMGESRFTPRSVVNGVIVEGVEAISGFVATSSNTHVSATVTVAVSDGFLTVDPSSGNNGKLASVQIVPSSAAPTDPPSGGGGDSGDPLPADPASLAAADINFQSNRAATPAGWIADIGRAFDSERGFGWRLPDGGTPQKRQCGDRNVSPNQVADTFCHTQTRYELVDGRWRATDSPAIWEFAVVDGTYRVEVVMGETRFAFASVRNRIVVEGTVAIADFVATNAEPQRSSTVIISVTDGMLTLDPTGGVKGKLASVSISPVSSS